MDFGKSLASSLIFDVLFPLAETAIKAGIPHGDAIAQVLDASKDVIKNTAFERAAGTSIGDAVIHTLQNHASDILEAGKSVFGKAIPKNDFVMQAVEAFGKTLKH